MYEDTNRWAAFFAQDAAKRKQATARAREKAAATRKRNAEMRSLGVAPKRGASEANTLTQFCLDWLRQHGHYGARINIGGIYKEDLKKWVNSGSTNGVADVIACISGRFCQFEIKAGKDKPREDQLKQQELTRRAGGIYEFIHNATEFVQVAQNIQTYEKTTNETTDSARTD